MLDNGGQAQRSGLKLGNRIVEVDGQLVTHWPHEYVMQLFLSAEVGKRPLGCIVAPPNALILASIRAGNNAVAVDNGGDVAAEIPGGALTKRRKRGPHVRVWTGSKEFIMDAGIAHFGEE